MKLNEVTQRRLEVYQEHLVTEGESVRSAARMNRIVIEAAAAAGIAEGLADDLGDLSPREVKRLTGLILEHVREATEPLTGEA